ncbi:MAG: bifunctional hydroxymethylpyrimidine kinase/phosphomethylpyrimidine kinase [Armatimonadetes bacterium]|nr:bifunctional hydroxymethylpyrimidine kinase/phosphomethylpyrimidine kinase [Armatimonadota bacterium]
MRVSQTPPVALTIAGSDSGGGAGVQADLKTFTVLGVYGASAITAVTSQNTVRVSKVQLLAPDIVVSQIRDVATDIGCNAAKTGMLGSAAIVDAVARAVEELSIAPLVVDPVMVAKSGDPLLADDAVETLRDMLLPLATVVTPNIPEAERLVGRKITTVAEMQQAAEEIASLGPKAVVIKGGHLKDVATDVVWLCDTGEIHYLTAPRLPGRNTHGTGCVFSAAITAELAKGRDIVEAVRRAKLLVTEAIRYGLPLGRGHGPANVMAAGAMVPSE